MPQRQNQKGRTYEVLIAGRQTQTKRRFRLRGHYEEVVQEKIDDAGENPMKKKRHWARICPGEGKRRIESTK